MAGAFLDPGSPPGRAEVVEALGDAAGPWDRVASSVESAYGVRPEPWFFGKESGWVARYRRSGRSLVVLLPERGRASAIVVIGPSAYPVASALPLEPPVRAALAAAHPYPEGRWVRVELTSDAVADDVVRLVAAKSPPPRHPGRRRVPTAVA
jgi:Protein of unknown function (DUF3788)